MVDTLLTSVDVNEALCRLLGYRREDIIGHSLLTFVAPVSRTVIEDHVITTLWQGWRSFEVTLRHKDGRMVVTEFHATTINDGAGRLAGAFAFVTDITVRKQAEDALHFTNAQTEAASQAKSTFLASMSHEVRTPLNAIIGFSDAILSELFGPLGNDRYRAYINDIHHSGLHVLELINDILDVAKIEAGRMELHEEPVSLAEIIQASFRLVQPRAVKGRVVLEVNIPSDRSASFDG